MRIATLLLGGAAASLVMPAGAAPARKPPYYASISATKARMRTGPGRTYPATWLYRRADLPVKVIDTFKEKRGGNWYKVEDPGGAQGWMQATLISDTRTAFVVGQVAELRDSPRVGARLLWRAAPGVVGRVSRCAQGWCYLDIKGQGGFVQTNRLWGVESREDLN